MSKYYQNLTLTNNAMLAATSSTMPHIHSVIGRYIREIVSYNLWGGEEKKKVIKECENELETAISEAKSGVK